MKLTNAINSIHHIRHDGFFYGYQKPGNNFLLGNISIRKCVPTRVDILAIVRYLFNTLFPCVEVKIMNPLDKIIRVFELSLSRTLVATILLLFGAIADHNLTQYYSHYPACQGQVAALNKDNPD